MNNILTSISFANFFETIKTIAADKNIYANDLESFSLENNELPNLQQINFFIGENNSGKSRFIRTLMKWLRFFHWYDLPHNISLEIDEMCKEENCNYEMMDGQVERVPNNFYNFDQAFSKLSKFNRQLISPCGSIKETLDVIKREFNAIKPTNEALEKQEATTNKFKKSTKKWDYLDEANADDESKEAEAEAQNNLEKKAINFYKTFEQLCENANNSLKKVLYIPLLRGAKVFETDIYLRKTKEEYGFSDDEIFTGLSIHKELTDMLKKRKDEALRVIKNLEKCLNEYFFEGENITITPEAGHLSVKIGEQEDRPLHNLGDGVQALIVLLFPLYMRKEEDYFIFIEEPEMHLYPKWQRLFIKILQTEFSKHQFFITTHSNVFINTPNCSVYQVTRDHSENKSFVKYALDDEKRKIINSLGYKASDMLQANYIIWVEGPTDPIYLRKFLELYDGKLTEGIDYAFMSFNGYSNLKHFVVGVEEESKIDVTKINPYCGFIIDSDRISKGGAITDKGGHKQKIQNQCSGAGLFCWITENKEFENHIIQRIWECAYTKLSNKAIKVNNKFSKKYDWCFHSRFTLENDEHIKTPNLYPSPPKDDKIKMAEQVIKIITKSDLEADTELHTAMTNLVEAIRKANKKH